MRLCRDLLLPSMVSHAFCDHLVRVGRALFDGYMVYLVAENRSSKGLHAANVFGLQLHGIRAFITELMTLGVDWKASLVRGCETKLSQLCALLVHVTTDPRFPEVNAGTKPFKALVACGPHIYRLFHMHLPPRPLIALHPEMVQLDSIVFPPPASVRALRETAVLTIQDYRAEHRCSGLNCNNSLQSVGKSFQRCGRCNVIPYCGRECQTQDWRNESFPHNRMCPILRDLVTKGGGWQVFSSGRDYLGAIPTVLRNWEAAAVSEEDLKYMDDWRKDREKRKTKLPDSTEWTPGFDDYDSIIWQFGASEKGPKPCYPNRLSRWPSEVAKVKELFEIMPFWEQEIV